MAATSGPGALQALGLALEHGWSINLGGGMHHASYDAGGGWCVYDDWTLALRLLRRASRGRVQKALMIDLDVHQVREVASQSHPSADSYAQTLSLPK